MDTILTLLLIEALFVVNFIGLYLFFKKKLIETDTRLIAIGSALNLIHKRIEEVHKRIDAIFTVDKPSENEATKVDENIVDLDENNAYDIPDNVKFAVEGGDSNVPPEYSN